MIQYLIHMKKLFVALMACALVLVSCQTEKQGKDEETGTPFTTLSATVSVEFIDIFDITFTVGGKPVAMSTSKNGNTVTFQYSDGTVRGNEEVKCEVAVSSKTDYAALAENFNLKVEHTYQTGKKSGSGYSELYRASNKIESAGSYSKLVEGKDKTGVSDKVTYAAYIAQRISRALTSTMK